MSLHEVLGKRVIAHNFNVLGITSHPYSQEIRQQEQGRSPSAQDCGKPMCASMGGGGGPTGQHPLCTQLSLFSHSGESLDVSSSGLCIILCGFPTAQDNIV